MTESKKNTAEEAVEILANFRSDLSALVKRAEELSELSPSSNRKQSQNTYKKNSLYIRAVSDLYIKSNCEDTKNTTNSIEECGSKGIDFTSFIERILYAAIDDIDHLDIAEVIIVKGIDVDHVNSKYTALHIVAIPEIVHALIRADVGVNAKDKNGHTALALATSEKEQKIVDAIREATTTTDKEITQSSKTAKNLSKTRENNVDHGLICGSAIAAHVARIVIACVAASAGLPMLAVGVAIAALAVGVGGMMYVMPTPDHKLTEPKVIDTQISTDMLCN